MNDPLDQRKAIASHTGSDQSPNDNSGLHSDDHPPWNYEVTVNQIEQIIAQIEAGKLELADVFEQFAIAVGHLRQCEAFLAQRQQQMDLLIETLADDTEPF